MRRVMTSHIMQHFNATDERILVQSELGAEVQGILKITTSRRAFAKGMPAHLLATNSCLIMFTTSVGPLPRPFDVRNRRENKANYLSPHY